MNDINIIKPPSPRLATLAGFGVSVLLTKWLAAKIIYTDLNAQMAAANMTTKIVSKITTLWLLLMSLLFPSKYTTVKALSQTTAPAITHTAPAKHHGIKQVSKPAPVAVVATPVNTKRLYLHTFEKEYTCVFTGKVMCGDNPCSAAEVTLRIASKQNPQISKTATLLPDGTYQVSFLLKEFLHEHVDWWIVADSPGNGTKHMQGRQILMDQSLVTIEEPIRLF